MPYVRLRPARPLRLNEDGESMVIRLPFRQRCASDARQLALKG